MMLKRAEWFYSQGTDATHIEEAMEIAVKFASMKLRWWSHGIFRSRSFVKSRGLLFVDAEQIRFIDLKGWNWERRFKLF